MFKRRFHHLSGRARKKTQPLNMLYFTRICTGILYVNNNCISFVANIFITRLHPPIFFFYRMCVLWLFPVLMWENYCVQHRSDCFIKQVVGVSSPLSGVCMKARKLNLQTNSIVRVNIIYYYFSPRIYIFNSMCVGIKRITLYCYHSASVDTCKQYPQRVRKPSWTLGN